MRLAISPTPNERVIVSLKSCTAITDIPPSVGPSMYAPISSSANEKSSFKKPVLGVTSFDTLAYNIQSGKVVAAIDARHGCYYACPYLNNKALTPAFVTEKELKEMAEGATIVSYPYADFDIEGKSPVAADPAKGLIKAVEDKIEEADENVDSLKPLYLRLSQAEEGRK